MAPRVLNVRVPDAKFLLRNGAGRSKYVPRVENSEFSITRITPQNALNLVKKFSDSELKTQYSPAEIEHLHDLASRALKDEIIGITGRDSEGKIAPLNENSVNWLLQNESLINRLAESGSRDAQALDAFCESKVQELSVVNDKLHSFYLGNSALRTNGGILVFNKETGDVSTGTSTIPESGALTNPPVIVPVRKGSTDLNVGDRPAFLSGEANASPREGIVMEDIPIVPEAENPAAASPSPEAIGEAMRDAVSKDGTVTVSPEAIAEEVVKEKANPKAATDGTEVKTAEAATGKAETPPEKRALTGEGEKPAESSQGLFSRLGGRIGRNLGKYLLGGSLGAIGWTVMNDLASDNSTLKSLFTEGYSPLDTNNPSANQPRNEPATNEEYTPGRIPDHITQDNLAPIKESTTSKKIKNQPQVVNTSAPVNNATADYVRAAYNSYIPSDAGRAYQKAIYGDPLELDRMRLQQQQQKWRDFVMRSGQSPAELVQRGLMPYDALQYV